MRQESAADPAKPAKPTTAAFLIQTALLRQLLVFSLHLPSSSFTSSSSCIIQSPAPADQLQLHQQQFLHLPSSSTCRPVPVLASSSYQHQQTSSSFTSSCSSATKLPAPITDQHQLHLAADFCITLVYKQLLLRLTQHTEATSTHPRLTNVLHNWVSDCLASAASN